MIPSSKSLSPLQLKLREKLAAAQAAKPKLKPSLHTLPQVPEVESSTIIATIPANPTPTGTDKHGNLITYNKQQQQAIDLVVSGQSCVIIGAAGTGKTTIQKAAMQGLLQSGKVAPRMGMNHKYLLASNPGIAICAYTRRATNNIRKNMSEDLQECCLTIHKLLEYAPVEAWITQEDGTTKRTMRFEPQRNSSNPLPPTLTTIVIEEASMVSMELFNELHEACPHNPQFVFLGDIQQLPPVFGSAILGYKMLELPVIELTEVHRQALNSPILSLAHRILRGESIPPKELQSLEVPGQLKLHPWKKQISAEAATITLAKFFIQALDEGKYNPETDGILIPFNKSCGTDELNKHIATRIATREQKEVFEIIHGFKKSYYSVGDKCLYDKEDCIIQSIYPNPQYAGTTPQQPSTTMDYWGHDSSHSSPIDDDEIDIDHILANISMASADENAVRQASHIIEVFMLDSERTVKLQSAGEVDAMILGYAITVHKSQGSEWEKVFLLFHKSHNTMLQRELLYTAVTRAKQELFCICEPDSFDKGITRQRIKGNTWQEKAEHFKGKIAAGIKQS